MRKPIPAHLQALILKTCTNEATEADLTSLWDDLINNSVIDETSTAEYLLSLEILDFSPQFTSLLASLHTRARVMEAILSIAENEKEKKEKRAHAYFYRAVLIGKSEYYIRAAQLGHKRAVSSIQITVRDFLVRKNYEACMNWLEIEINPRPESNQLPAVILEALIQKGFSASQSKEEAMQFLCEHAHFLNQYLPELLKKLTELEKIFYLHNIVSLFYHLLLTIIPGQQLSTSEFQAPIASFITSFATQLVSLELEGKLTNASRFFVSRLLRAFPSFFTSLFPQGLENKIISLLKDLAQKDYAEACADLVFILKKCKAPTIPAPEDSRLALPYLVRGARLGDRYCNETIALLYINNKFPDVYLDTIRECFVLAAPYLQAAAEKGSPFAHFQLARGIQFRYLPDIPKDSSLTERLHRAKPYLTFAATIPMAKKAAERLAYLPPQDSPQATALQEKVSNNPELQALKSEIEAKRKELEELIVRANNFECDLLLPPAGIPGELNAHVDSQEQDGVELIADLECYGSPELTLNDLGSVVIKRERSPGLFAEAPQRAQPEADAQSSTQKRPRYPDAGDE